MTTITLEDAIRNLATRGEISHISLTPSQNGTKWRGSYAMSSKFGVSFAEDADPVKALMLAMTTGSVKARPPTKRDTDAAEARSTGSIPQETTDANPVADEFADLM